MSVPPLAGQPIDQRSGYGISDIKLDTLVLTPNIFKVPVCLFDQDGDKLFKYLISSRSQRRILSPGLKPASWQSLTIGTTISLIPYYHRKYSWHVGGHRQSWFLASGPLLHRHPFQVRCGHKRRHPERVPRSIRLVIQIKTRKDRTR